MLFVFVDYVRSSEPLVVVVVTKPTMCFVFVVGGGGVVVVVDCVAGLFSASCCCCCDRANDVLCRLSRESSPLASDTLVVAIVLLRVIGLAGVIVVNVSDIINVIGPVDLVVSYS